MALAPRSLRATRFARAFRVMWFGGIVLRASAPATDAVAGDAVGATEVVAVAAPPAPLPPAVPEEVTVRSTVSPRTAASDVVVGSRELSMRPRLRAEEILESVPGLFTVQHSGGAKAQQYFLRGFDADHGTDIAFFADGVPLNAVSHVHGQGYTDLHFMIPEVVASLAATKGPYSPSIGDFATAGSVNLRLADHFDESFARAEVGSDGLARALVVESPDLGAAWRAVAAVEVFAEAGQFIHPEDHRRLNGYARVTRVLSEASELSFTAMGYGATWNASGLLPVRAVCGENGAPAPGRDCVSRWDSFDPTQGGAAQRAMGSIAYRLRLPKTDVEATAYAVRSNLKLFLDDTLVDPLEQDDTRTVIGLNARASRRSRVAGLQLNTSLGFQVRSDGVDNASHHQEQRRRLDTQFSSAIHESELGAYLEEDFRPVPWIRFILGGRLDRVDVAVHDDATNSAVKLSGVQGDGLFSPKAVAVVSPMPGIDLFVDYGRGFHSNDARGVVHAGATMLAVATGYEAGVEIRPSRLLSFSATAFLLDLASELVFQGDDGTTVPSGATRREGVECVARYRLHEAIYADAELTVTRARFRHDDGSGSQVPLAPTRMFAAGIGARKPIGALTAMGAIRVKSLADRPATQDGSISAQGFTLIDVQAGIRWRQMELSAELLNSLDQRWREGQFVVASRIVSRLPPEAQSVTGLSFTPGWSRELIGRWTLYW
jgi:outer membrane receptor protein involved in Fe transport